MRTEQKHRKNAKKFMQVLSLSVFTELKERSEKKGITVQEYLRAIVVPTFLEANPENPIRRKMIKDKKKSISARKAWNTRRSNLIKKKSKEDVEIPVSATRPIGNYPPLPPLPPPSFSKSLSNMEA